MKASIGSTSSTSWFRAASGCTPPIGSELEDSATSGPSFEFAGEVGSGGFGKNVSERMNKAKLISRSKSSADDKDGGRLLSSSSMTQLSGEFTVNPGLQVVQCPLLMDRPLWQAAATKV